MPIKSKSIEELYTQKYLNNFLEKTDYKFVKKDSCLKLKSGEFSKQIRIHINEQQRISFNPYLMIPKFEKWYYQQLQRTPHFRFVIKLPNQQNSFPIIGDNHLPEEVISYLEKIVVALENAANFEYILKNKESEFMQVYADILVYRNRIPEAKELYKKINQHFGRTLTETNNFRYLGHSRDLRQKVKKLIDLDLDVFRLFQLKITQNKSSLSFIGRTYTEILSLNFKSHHSNNFSILQEKELILINAPEDFFYIINFKGEIVKEFNLDDFPELKGKAGHKIQIGMIESKNLFFIENYIIDDRLKVKKLEINSLINKRNPTHKSESTLIGLFYEVENDEFYLYIHNVLFIYNDNYQYVREIEFSSVPKEVNFSHGKIVFINHYKSIHVTDLTGTPIIKYENKKIPGSSSICSPKSEYFYFYFNGTKSYLFDLNKESAKVLWAHPTYIKDYKSNFIDGRIDPVCLDVNKAKISPDSSYLVCGAFKGKYVTFNLPNCERKELIPKKYLDKLQLTKEVTTVNNSKTTTKTETIEAKVIELDNEEYLIGYDDFMIKDIQFYDNGNYFSIQIMDDVLFWNKSFKHVETLLNVGTIDNISEEIILVRKEDKTMFYRMEN